MTEITQSITLPGGVKITGPLSADVPATPAEVFSTRIVPIVFVLAGFLLLVMLLISGYQFIMSRGDPKALDQARGRLTFALIGFLIVFGSYWLLVLLNTALGNIFPLA